MLVENFRTGALERYGLDAQTLCARYPRLVYCSISGYGRTGARAADAGYDLVIQAESGLMSITGEPGCEPQKFGVAISDLVAGMHATKPFSRRSMRATERVAATSSISRCSTRRSRC